MNDNEFEFEPKGEPENRNSDSDENTAGTETEQENYSGSPDNEQPGAEKQTVPEQPAENPPVNQNSGYAPNGNSGQYAYSGNPYTDSRAYSQPNAQEPFYSPYSEKNAQQNNPYGQQNYQNPGYGTNTFSNTAPENKKSGKKGFKGFLIALVAVIVCAAVLLSVVSGSKLKNGNSGKNQSAAKDSTEIEIAAAPSLSEASKSASEIAAAAQKFNVGILVYGRTQSFMSSSTGNSLVGEGSGIVMGQDKSKTYTYIITCAHVVSKVKTSGFTMTVQDCNSKTYEAELVGFDSKTDVGVIKVKTSDLTAAPFGDSSNLVIGQKVYAIGNPGGTEFFGSFTNGMISAIDRPISSESGYEMKCIQHTTPINSGNSGGALLNEAGQVIGINSSKIVSTGYEGMAFSIPITEAKPIIDDIIAHGYVTNRPKLGISYYPATAYQEYSMVIAVNHLPAGSLIIAKISEDSALAKTDARVGDMITAVNGKDLTTADVLLDVIENGNVGDTLKLTIARINDDYSIKTFTITVSLVEDDGTGSELETTTTTNFFDQFGY